MAFAFQGGEADLRCSPNRDLITVGAKCSEEKNKVAYREGHERGTAVAASAHTAVLLQEHTVGVLYEGFH